jgi:hypothetical protein
VYFRGPPLRELPCGRRLKPSLRAEAHATPDADGLERLLCFIAETKEPAQRAAAANIGRPQDYKLRSLFDIEGLRRRDESRRGTPGGARH